MTSKSGWITGCRGAHRRSGKKRYLLSLIGVLQHVATVVKPGRTFVRSLIDASTTVKSLEHYIHLNAHARADIMWWHLFAQLWNGTSLLPSAEPTQATYSDASGSWGCGVMQGAVVPSSMASIMGVHAHIAERASTHRNCDSSVGRGLGWPENLLLL